jgi:hypothetical protein
MPSSVRELILSNLETVLSGITTVGGYENDIASVQRWKQRGNPLKDVPCIIVTAGPEDKKKGPNPLVTARLKVYLELYSRQDETDANATDTILNSILKDIEKALYADVTRGGVAVDTDVQEVVPFGAEVGNGHSGLIIGVEILYRHLATNPAQAA